MPIVKLLSENPEPRWATHAIVFQGKKLLFRSRTEAETAAVTLRKKGISVQVMAIRERAKNPRRKNPSILETNPTGPYRVTRKVNKPFFQKRRFAVDFVVNNKWIEVATTFNDEEKAIEYAQDLANRLNKKVRVRDTTK